MTTLAASKTRSRWPSSAEMEDAARQLATATAAGAVAGLLVGGIGGRLAMMLLARLNPETTGILSDDGFVIGQFTPSGTVNLLVVATLLGVLGAGIYVVLRNLMIGPRWFQVLSISLGAAVVVGAIIVNSTGVDFTFLRPTLLPVALFVAIPGLYAALLTVLCERWLNPGGRFQRARWWAALMPLILWLPLAPVPLGLALAWMLVVLARRQPRTRALVEHPAIPWLARLALTGVFAMFVIELVGDILVLT